MQGVAAAGTNFLIGAPSFELKGQKADYFNSAYLVAPGEILGKYDKAHLVPFGEYTPFKEYLPFLGKIVEHVGDFKAGPEGHTLALGGAARSASRSATRSFSRSSRAPRCATGRGS